MADFKDIIKQREKAAAKAKKKAEKGPKGPSLLEKLSTAISERTKKPKAKKEPKQPKPKKQPKPQKTKTTKVKQPKEPGLKGFIKRHKRKIAIGALSGVLLGNPATLAGGLYVAPIVAAKSSPETKRIKAAKSQLESEVKVYYADGETAFDSLSKGTKLTFLDFDDINPYLAVAAMAAEDRNFREQKNGLSYSGLLRASLGQFTRGAVGGGGGSTIDVQTAKQLWHGRVTRGISDKLKQYTDAARLSHTLSKDEILALYLNSMHVSGRLGEGGRRGLAEAANYYFDKEQEELNFEEAAFATATLKGAAGYYPFSTNEKRKVSRMKKSKGRIRYILPAMKDIFPKEVARLETVVERAERRHKKLESLVNSGKIHEDRIEEATEKLDFLRERAEKKKNTLAKYKQAKKVLDKNYDRVMGNLRDKDYQIKFSKGGSNYLKAAVIKRINEDLRELEEEGIIELPLPPGSKVITTLSEIMQNALTYHLRHNAGNTSVILDGYEKPKEKGISKVNVFEERKFQFGEVAKVGEDSITLRFKGGTTASIDRKGLEEIVATDTMHEKRSNKRHIRRKIWKDMDEHLGAFLKDIKKGDILYTSVREIEQEENEQGDLIDIVRLSLEQYPASVQGSGVFIGKDNKVKAFVGNVYDKGGNLDFATIPKQPGSGWKPVIVFTAIKYGLDCLEAKIRNTSTYYAYGAERSKQDGSWRPQSWSVSLEHMGGPLSNCIDLIGQSRNPATGFVFVEVLPDLLDDEEYLAKAAEIGIGIGAEETPKEYRARLRDKFDISFDGSWRKEYYIPMTKFNIGRRQLKKVLSAEEAENLGNLVYGYKQEQSLKNLEIEIVKTPYKSEENKKHRPYVKYNYLYLTDTLPAIKETVEKIKTAHKQRDKERFNALVGEYLYINEDKKRVVFGTDELKLPRVNPDTLFQTSEQDLESAMATEDIWVNDLLRIRTIKQLEDVVTNIDDKNIYRPEFILHHPNARMRMSHEMVRGTILEYDPDLDIGASMGPAGALGVFELSPWAFAKWYKRLLSPGADIPFVGKIIGPRGDELYVLEEFEGDGEVDPAVSQIIQLERAVTTHGTAIMGGNRYRMDKATNEVKITPKFDPAPYKVGKTGTTNKSKQATFSGFYADTEEETISLQDLGAGVVFIGDYLPRGTRPRCEKAKEKEFPSTCKEAMKDAKNRKKYKTQERCEKSKFAFCMAPQGMEKYRRNINIFGGGTAGVIYSNTINSINQVTSELEIPGAREIFVWKKTGFPVDPKYCENDIQLGYCKQGYKVVGLGKLLEIEPTSP